MIHGCRWRSLIIKPVRMGGYITEGGFFMKKKILIVSLLLLVGAVVAVFAATRCKNEFKYYADSWSSAEWVQCELDDGHHGSHQGHSKAGKWLHW
jgi:hypothetical protein